MNRKKYKIMFGNIKKMFNVLLSNIVYGSCHRTESQKMRIIMKSEMCDSTYSH